MVASVGGGGDIWLYANDVGSGGRGWLPSWWDDAVRTLGVIIAAIRASGRISTMVFAGHYPVACGDESFFSLIGPQRLAIKAFRAIADVSN